MIRAAILYAALTLALGLTGCHRDYPTPCIITVDPPTGQVCVNHDCERGGAIDFRMGVCG